MRYNFLFLLCIGFFPLFGVEVGNDSLVLNYIKGRRADLYKKLPSQAVVAEIGVEHGTNARAILNIAMPRRLYLIDCWQQQDSKIYKDDACNLNQKGQNDLYLKVINTFLGDLRVTVIRAFSHEAACFFRDEFFDWIYIDANHGYDAVRSDLNTWFSKVKNGGYISGHDYGKNGSGVQLAVDEFARQHKTLITYLTLYDGENNSWAIKKTIN